MTATLRTNNQLATCGFLIAALFALNAAAQQQRLLVGHVEQVDPDLAHLIDAQASCEVLATGYRWAEGPAWQRSRNALLFSDVPQNAIHRWTASEGAVQLMKNSEQDRGGSNGLMFDAEERLVVCDHGHRRVYRIEQDGTKTTIADTYDGKRFNSPNDLVFHANGDLYFTDPPYGLKDESSREIEWHGVYRVRTNGAVDLLTKELERPNGIGLSPDGKTLYVAQSDKTKAIYMAYEIQADGTLAAGKLLFDATRWVTDKSGLPDGMAIDQQGNLWATGPGGVLILTPQGKLLGRIMTGRATANCAFGEDGSTLFMTAGSTLLRIATKTKRSFIPAVIEFSVSRNDRNVFGNVSKNATLTSFERCSLPSAVAKKIVE